MVRVTARRGARVLVIDIGYAGKDGKPMRFRRDAVVQTMTAARDEDRRRLAALAKTGSPHALVDEGAVAAEARVTPAPSDEMLFSTLCARFLKEHAPSAFSPSTCSGYTSAINCRLIPEFGRLPVSKVDWAAVLGLNTRLASEGASRCVRRNLMIVLRSILCRFAIQVEILKVTPRLPKVPKRGDTIPRFMTAAEFTRVVCVGCVDRRDRLICLLGGHAGLRRGEILALRCRDVNFEINALVVANSIVAGVEGPPKSGHQRSVPLTPELLAELKAAGADTRHGDERVVRNLKSTSGDPFGQSGLRLRFQRALKRAGLSRRRLHDLRHYFVTALLRGGSPVHVVRELAGHADLNTTQRYAHAVATDKTDAIRALGTTFGDLIAAE